MNTRFNRQLIQPHQAVPGRKKTQVQMIIQPSLRHRLIIAFCQVTVTISPHLIHRLMPRK